MAKRLRRSKDDDRTARPSHPSLRYHRNRQRELALQKPRLTRHKPLARYSASPGRARSRLTRHTDSSDVTTTLLNPAVQRGQCWAPIRGQSSTPINIWRFRRRAPRSEPTRNGAHFALFFSGSDFHQSEVAITVVTPWWVFARDPECRTGRAGISREHHEVVVGAILEGGRVIETGDRIGQPPPLAHVAKVVPEMLSWFEFDFFSNRIGCRTARWNPTSAEENVPGPHNASG